MFKRIIVAAMLGCLLCGAAMAEDRLATGFVTPPDSARIWVYWFWLNGNITREGITADLEAMKRAGVGGVLIMEVDQGTPAGPVAFMSAEWRRLFKYMVTEADRLGLQVNMNNDAGWNGSGGPWVPLDKAMQVVVTSETRVAGGKRFEGALPMPAAKKGFYRDIAVLAFPTPALPPDESHRVKNLPAKSVSWPYISGYSTGTDRDAEVPAEAMIDKERLVDLTAHMVGDGRLAWDAPAAQGNWTVVRFGHTFNGAESHPAPATGAGPECDKLSKEGIEAHFNGMIGKLIEDVGTLAGKTFAATHVDSWEVGGGNWTPKMREEFKRLRGYDMLPFLPVLTGRFVDSVDVTERFLWDLRQTCSELLAANYIGHLGKLAHDRGLRLSMETYGTPALDMDVVNHVDEPVCEFWWSGGGRLDYSLKSMSSAAHAGGRPIVGAEAFTSNRHEKWRAHPAIIKARGDRAFCEGVNRLIVHRYAMQPWVEDRRPGMSMGPYGLHYERTQTWWEDSKAWHQYVARCQYLLRQGTFVADCLSLQPEEPMQRFNLLKLPGYDYDGIGPRAFLEKVTVEDGRLTLPSGMRYRLLALSRTNTETMTVPMLSKIKRLVEDGAAVLGTAPDATPGLADYPNADKVLKRLAADLWGADPTVKERAVGKGRVFRGMKPEDVLARLGVVPDFGSDERVRWIHRKVDDADIYFVATCVNRAVDATCTFRVSGRQPELWNPEAGTIQAIPYYWAEANGRTSVPLQFAPSGSAFIVFREKASPSRQVVRVIRKAVLLASRRAPAAAPTRVPAIDLVNGTVSQSGAYEIQMGDGRTYRCEVSVPEPMTISGPWELKLAPGGGVPEKITLGKLVSWSHHGDPGVKHFSGSGTYYKRFEITPDLLKLKSTRDPRARILLDLGKVAVMAQVKLNGRDFGVLWKAPYRVDVTDAVEAGENVLEVRVVNLWINRMIGDEFLPDDSERDNRGTLKVWPAWLQEGRPSPTGRHTFTTWRLWKKDSPLRESGLLGPVALHAVVELSGYSGAERKR